jgi:hypothetical protein
MVRLGVSARPPPNRRFHSNSSQIIQPMNEHTISVTLPVERAIERVKQVLFRPFDLGKWFGIGFCAWLAYLGQTGGAGFHFNLPGGKHGSGADFRQGFDRVRDYVMANLYWLAPLVAAAVVFCLGLWVLFTWLHSRGEFMFLHCVAVNRAEIEVPWNGFAREGNSLFWFRLGVGLLSMVVMWPLLILGGLKTFHMAMDQNWNFHGVATAVGFGLALILAGVVFAIIKKLTSDFVVPIMRLRRKRCLAGWAEARRLFSTHLGQLVLYFLFQIVLSIASAFIVLAAVLVTCCLAGCFLALPYLGTVLLLPVLVFKRSYSLHYLAQYGPEYDVFSPREPPPAAAPARPVQ